MQIKKSLLTAIFAVATMFTGASAFAQVTVTAGDGTFPVAAPGETVVFEDIIFTATAGGDMNTEDKAILLLPTGANFVGTPTATATGTVGTGTVRIKGNSAGDPSQSGLVSLLDTNGDGGMDRAEVTVTTSATAADLIIFRGSMTWTGTVTATGATAQGVAIAGAASFFNDGDNAPATPAGTFNPAGQAVTLANRTLAANVGTFADFNGSNAAINIPATMGSAVALPASSTFLLRLPAGAGATTATRTVTLTMAGGTGFDATTTIVVTPLTQGVAAVTGLTSPAGADSTAISFELGGALTRDSQYLVTIGAAVDVLAATVGTATVTVSGDSGATGSANLANLAATGSTLKLTTGQTISSLVRGAAAFIALPTFEIKEVFGSDFGTAAVTVVVTAPTGVTFDTTGAAPTIASNDGATVIGAVTRAAGLTTFAITPASNAAETLTITGLRAKAATTASSEVNVTFAASTLPNKPATAFQVATATNRGAVTLTGPTTKPTIGKGTTSTAVINLSEATYGAITRANSNAPFIRVSPSSNVTITAAGVTSTAVTKGLLINNSTPSVPSDGSVVLSVASESTSKLLTTDVYNLTVNYTVKSTAAVGSDVAFTFAGDANVAGTVSVATVQDGTISSVKSGTAIPDVAAGGVTAVKLATLEVKEAFAGALSTTAGRNLRVIAPSGIAFEAVADAAPTGLAFVGVTSTFNPNDTLTLSFVGTAGVDTLSYTPTAFISSGATPALNSFSIADGNGQSGAAGNAGGVTAATVNLAYVGDVAALKGGTDISAFIGVPRTQAFEGGLGPYTIASDDATIASAALSGMMFTVTPLKAGIVQVTITDSLGATDVVEVVVAASVAPPALTTTKSDGTTTTAVVSGGISTDGGGSIDTDGVAVGDALTILATVAPEAADVGKEAQIIVAVANSDNTGIQLLTAGGLAPASPIVPFSTITLAASNTINILSNFNVAAEFAGANLVLYVGYQVDGVLIYNTTPIALTIGAVTP